MTLHLLVLLKLSRGSLCFTITLLLSIFSNTHLLAAAVVALAAVILLVVGVKRLPLVVVRVVQLDVDTLCRITV